MRTTPRRAAGALAALAVLASVAGCATSTVRQAPDFAARRAELHTVALAGVRAEAPRAAAKAARAALAKPLAAAAERLPDLLASALEARGMKVVEVDLAAEAEGSTPRRESDALYAELAKADAQLWQQVAISKGEALAMQASLGASARTLADPLGADAVLLARYAVFDDAGAKRDEDEEDAAERLLEAALVRRPTSKGPLRGAVLEVALAESRDGAILWAHAAARSDPTERALEPLVAAVFAAFPAPTQE